MLCISHMKKLKRRISDSYIVFSFSSINVAFWCLFALFFRDSVFSCGLEDFKFQYVNLKAFNTSFLYWGDFWCLKKKERKKLCCWLSNYLIFQKTELNLLSEAAVSRFGLIWILLCMLLLLIWGSIWENKLLLENCEKKERIKGQPISECLFDFFRFSKKPKENLTNFCPII